MQAVTDKEFLMPTETQAAASQASAANRTIQLLTFKLDDQEYALDIANVVEVVRMVAVTRAPKAPPFVKGMVNLRGRVIPVIDLRKRCDLRLKPYDLNTQLLIARTNQHAMALMVDVVSEVLTMPAGSIEPPELVGTAMQFVRAVGKLGDRLILILDPETLLDDDDADLNRNTDKLPAGVTT
jgi:purine-binding chemotaxis protein CheW